MNGDKTLSPVDVLLGATRAIHEKIKGLPPRWYEGVHPDDLRAMLDPANPGHAGVLHACNRALHELYTEAFIVPKMAERLRAYPTPGMTLRRLLFGAVPRALANETLILAYALIEEAVEVMRELPSWKPWKKTHGTAEGAMEAAQASGLVRGEIVDAAHFINQLAFIWFEDHASYEDTFMRKLTVNIQRQLEGY
jgi:hypothetical protein